MSLPGWFALDALNIRSNHGGGEVASAGRRRSIRIGKTDKGDKGGSRRAASCVGRRGRAYMSGRAGGDHLI